MLQLETFEVGQLGCNCSILWNEEGKEAIIVDPGDEAERIVDFVQSRNLTVKALVHTHAHFDHIMASGAVKKSLNAPIYLHRADLFLYEKLPEQGRMFGITVPPPDQVDHYLRDEEEVLFNGKPLKTLFTPGHTPGSCCFHFEGENSILFSGDTLFYRSIGRTDLWGGDGALIQRSIKNRLYTLDDDTMVICGHGPNTTIGQEKRKNQHCRP